MPRRRGSRDLGGAVGSFFDTLGPLLNQQYEREQWEEQNLREDRRLGFNAINSALSQARQSGVMDPEELGTIATTAAGPWSSDPAVYTDLIEYGEAAGKAYTPSLPARETGVAAQLKEGTTRAGVLSAMERGGLGPQIGEDLQEGWGKQGLLDPIPFALPEGPQYDPESLTARLLDVPEQLQLQSWQQAQREGAGPWSMDQRFDTQIHEGRTLNVMREPRYDEPGFVDVYETSIVPYDPQRIEQLIQMMTNQGRSPEDIQRATDLAAQGHGGSDEFRRIVGIDMAAADIDAEGIAGGDTAGAPSAGAPGPVKGRLLWTHTPRGIVFPDAQTEGGVPPEGEEEPLSPDQIWSVAGDTPFQTGPGGEIFVSEQEVQRLKEGKNPGFWGRVWDTLTELERGTPVSEAEPGYGQHQKFAITEEQAFGLHWEITSARIQETQQTITDSEETLARLNTPTGNAEQAASAANLIPRVELDLEAAREALKTYEADRAKQLASPHYRSDLSIQGHDAPAMETPREFSPPSLAPAGPQAPSGNVQIPGTELVTKDTQVPPPPPFGISTLLPGFTPGQPVTQPPGAAPPTPPSPYPPISQIPGSQIPGGALTPPPPGPGAQPPLGATPPPQLPPPSQTLPGPPLMRPPAWPPIPGGPAPFRPITQLPPGAVGQGGLTQPPPYSSPIPGGRAASPPGAAPNIRGPQAGFQKPGGVTFPPAQNLGPGLTQPPKFPLQATPNVRPGQAPLPSAPGQMPQQPLPRPPLPSLPGGSMQPGAIPPPSFGLPDAAPPAGEAPDVTRRQPVPRPPLPTLPEGYLEPGTIPPPPDASYSEALTPPRRRVGEETLTGDALPEAGLGREQAIVDMVRRGPIGQRIVEAIGDSSWWGKAKGAATRSSADTLGPAYVEEVLSWAPLIDATAKQYGLDPALVWSVIHQESTYDKGAVGPQTKYGQALGLMQILVTTAMEDLNRGKEKLFSMNETAAQQELLIPEKNIRGGTKYLKQLTDWAENHEFLSTPVVLAAYNDGMGDVRRTIPHDLLQRTTDEDFGDLVAFYKKMGNTQTSNYIQQVMDRWKDPAKRRGLVPGAIQAD